MCLLGQLSRFYEAMKQPEGNVYFAGEHISIQHTWMLGGTDTAVDAVKGMLGNGPLKRHSSKLDAGPVRLGWQVADGIPVRMDTQPNEPLVQQQLPTGHRLAFQDCDRERALEERLARK